ncbi:hypothetical protein GCM10008955_31380 [Deinococcus malanensis]|uniref:histidine kinase n=2 Tax=Deinococcus malanensis TaxID=1706855 RepID=A0ABQ2F2T6_9DEIO|nr:hypothetical protein GCM10008955_31380 [Deinococcus malanensis]
MQGESHALQTLGRIQQTISAELDLEKVVQAVTDAGVELTGAQFGAFFYTLSNHQGEPMTLYTLSGAPIEAFAQYPLPRMTQIFGPTFRNERVVRSDDITQDPRYARNAPYHGMPAGHLPVRSYLAVPVVGSTGEVIGGFFFGHERAAIFTEQAEQLAVSLASQAAAAFQNAQLYRSARRSEHRFRSLVEATSQMVWTRAPSGEFRTPQADWQRFTGQTEQEHLGWGWLDAIHPDDREHIRQAWVQATDLQTLYQMENRVRRWDGQYRIMRARATPVRNEDGTVEEWVGVHEDITERREAEQQLRDREARYQALVEYAVVGVSRLTPSGVCIDINPAGAAFLGHPREALIGGHIEGFAHPDDQQATELALQNLLEGSANAVTLEKRYLRPDGSIVWSNSSVSAVRQDDGTVAYLVATLSDITARKEAEADLLRLNADLERRVEQRTAELQRSNAELEHFAAVASHDLKAPLRTITSFLQLLKRRYGGQLDEKADRYIALTVDAARGMDALIDDLLTYSRVGRQRTITTVDPEHVMARVADNLSASVEEKGARLRVGRLPQVQADATQVQQVLQNLVANALKFQPPGRTPEVEVSACSQDEWVQFEVEDNGIGIAPEHLETVFGVFQRVHGQSEYAGSGLGLAIVRKIVEEHGGRIWVTSVEGEGTSFHFTLPGGDPVIDGSPI